MNARFGTSSVRRQAQLLRQRPDLAWEPLARRLLPPAELEALLARRPAVLASVQGMS